MSDEMEIVDPQQAQQFLLESWALSRSGKLTPTGLSSSLRVALELANEGQPIAPLGFINDLVSALLGPQYLAMLEGQVGWSTVSPDASLARRYEDYVLGKFAADMSLERASDEMQKYKERERDRALAYAVQQVQQRALLPKVLIGPASIKALSSLNSSALQKQFYESLDRGISDATYRQWDDLIQAVRNCGELLAAEDIFELASGTALSKFGQRLALRQVMQASQFLVVGLPKQKPTGVQRNYAVATNILEEDLYPVGGFSSIANRGTIESLLRSELAYMEVDERPDLFDIKYARDELLYYSRDENQFFRRRVTVMFVLDSSLTLTRVKDAGAAWQRIVLTMGMIVNMVRSLTDWLASDALQFDLLFLSDLAKNELQQEREIFELLFRDEIHSGRMAIAEVNQAKLRSRCMEQAKQSLCQCVHVHARQSNNVDAWLDASAEVGAHAVWKPLFSELCVTNPWPIVAYDEQEFQFDQSHEPWREALQTLLGAISV